jgi:hypothetical protein
MTSAHVAAEPGSSGRLYVRRRQQMQRRAQLWIVAAAIVSLGAGAALSRVVEPGARISLHANRGNPISRNLGEFAGRT